MTDKEFLYKFDNEIRFTKEEVSDIVIPGVGKIVCKIEGDEHRWTREMRQIFQIGERYFAIDYDRALTEMGENEYWYQPLEVEKYTYEKVVTITEWKEKQK